MSELLPGRSCPCVDRLADALLALRAPYRAIDREAFTADLGQFLARYEGTGIAEISLMRLIEEGLVIVRRHRLQLPREIALLLRVLVIDQGVAARLDPDFQVQAALAPYAQRLMIPQFAFQLLVTALTVLAMRSLAADPAGGRVGLESRAVVRGGGE